MRVPVGRALAVATVAAIGATGAMSGLAAENPAANGMTIVAQFADASPILVGNEVKVDGVAVGEVADAHVTNGHADVLLKLDPAALPVYSDATARIRPVSLLGERYIDLKRGTPTAPRLHSGGTLPMSQTSANVDLDEILNTIDEPTGESLAFLVTTLGEGLRDNGGNVDAALRALAPALRDTQSLTSVLKDQNALLGNLVDNVQPVASALAADDGKSLDSLVDSADRLLAASTAQQQQFDQTLAQLPGTLRSARSALGELAGTAEQATPTLRAVRPVTENLSAISDELSTFADSLDPALANSQPVLEKAQKLLDEAQPVAADLRAGSPDLRAAAGSARPLVDDLTGNLNNVFDFIRYWALTTNGHDGLSHYFRVNMIVNPDSLTGLLPGAAPVPQLLPSPPPIGGQQPGSNASAPVGTLLQAPTTAPQPGGPDATGLTPEQEHGMVGFLLGGKS
ncbi:MlaD family protein [Pseudonocardia acidicola]|uniref:MCE family protein n=1 Tax=Pseudonocardia acidicola TaxID=2724939 RepID=A0ABX1SG57_9PSEU|nr:MlaD family protein [Pseudonocardia acidicola]NMI00552.1 MCE family protein [Pseudonocardia acidicola]